MPGASLDPKPPKYLRAMPAGPYGELQNDDFDTSKSWWLRPKAVDLVGKTMKFIHHTYDSPHQPSHTIEIHLLGPHEHGGARLPVPPHSAVKVEHAAAPSTSSSSSSTVVAKSPVKGYHAVLRHLHRLSGKMASRMAQYRQHIPSHAHKASGALAKSLEPLLRRLDKVQELLKHRRPKAPKGHRHSTSSVGRLGLKPCRRPHPRPCQAPDGTIVDIPLHSKVTASRGAAHRSVRRRRVAAKDRSLVGRQLQPLSIHGRWHVDSWAGACIARHALVKSLGRMSARQCAQKTATLASQGHGVYASQSSASLCLVFYGRVDPPKSDSVRRVDPRVQCHVLRME